MAEQRRDKLADIRKDGLGRRVWVIAEGYIPSESTGDGDDRVSHETACLLNTSSTDAHVEITIYFTDRGQAGPFTVLVPAERTVHQRFNDLVDPEAIPRDTDFASVIRSDVPIVVQHTRLDTRQSALGLLSTIGWPSDT